LILMLTSRRYRDRLGKPVPARLKIVWQGRDNLDEMRSNLHKWRGGLAGAVAGARAPQVKRTFSAFQGVPIEEISKLVKQIDALLGAAMPQVVCQCRERWCPFCEGKGWLNACDARRISNQGLQPALLESLGPPPSSATPPEALDRSAERNSESAMIRLLWLLAGPPDVSWPADDRETALASPAESSSTTT